VENSEKRDKELVRAGNPVKAGPRARKTPSNVPTPPRLPLLEQSGLVLFKFDVTTRQMVVSKTALELLGFTRREIGKDPSIAAKSIDAARTAEYANWFAKPTTASEAGTRLDLRLLARDGAEVEVDTMVFPVLAKDGSVTALKGVPWDACELVQLQGAAQEGRDRFRPLFEKSPLPLLVYYPETLVIQQANDRACLMYGVDRDQLEGSFISDHVAPDEWPRALEHMQSDPPTLAVHILQRCVHRRSDGTRFPAQVTGVATALDGVRLRLVAVRDLSNPPADEDSAAALHGSTDASPLPVVVLDAAFAIEHANAPSGMLWALPPQQLEGRDFADGIDAASLPHFAEMRATAERGFPVRGEVLLKRPGSPLRAELDITRVEGQSPGRARYVARVRPVDDRSGAAPREGPIENALFFDLLAHDVTNYLTAVQGYLELVLASSGLPASAARLARVARQQSQNALELVKETRRIVGIGREDLQGSEVGDLLELLDEAVDRVEPLVRGRRLRVRRQFGTDEAPVAQPGLLREVLVNLLHNAVKYDAHEEILLDLVVERVVRGGSPHFMVRVADHGVGIPDVEKVHLFARGMRPRQVPGAGADTMAPSGSGIGLSLCKFLIGRCGGTIDVENRVPGDYQQGTAFVIFLPAA
jgi:PAS domain S-box-containing protein